ncbi:MAG TPA: 23S rRNA (guanosine(2251)-2'-O)-methyltransferase RlmB [Candidatus Limnocylindrales bacterium]|nr:23S rRNA (guanosine(2251)-2'-O)-methyltransferase RlmB [Candidatus Limnocylindrales bacterium]
MPRPGPDRPPWQRPTGSRPPTDRTGFDRPRPAPPWAARAPGGSREGPHYRRREPAPLPAGLVGEGEQLVAGRRPVEEAFVARRPAIRLLVVPQRRQALERIVLHATSLRIPIVEVEGGTLTSLAGFDGHQGIALVVGPRQFASLDEVLARGIERREAAFVLAMDSLEDPQNVGTLLRSAEAAGVHGVLYPTHRQAPLSPAAIKASAGAVEHLRLCPVDDLPAALSDLRARGLRVVGAEAGAAMTVRQADLRGPIAIVVGSEGQGLSPAVRRRCDFVVRIPMRGAIDSLNAAVAGSILVFEVAAQRDPEGRGAAPPAESPSPAAAGEGAAGQLGDDASDRDGEPGDVAVEPAPVATAEATATPSVEAPAEGGAEPTDVPPPDELLPGGPEVGRA